jgi:membrane protein YqaA with SNARE-associated domain
MYVTAHSKEKPALVFLRVLRVSVVDFPPGVSLKLFKTIFAKYSAWLLRLLAHFGPWGVLVIAVTDNVIPVIPLDAVVGGYVYRDPHRLLFYVLMATLGSAAGALVPFFIGRAGGELLLLKRIDRARLERMQKRYERQEFFFIAIPSMLPPPTPMKLIILSAGAFEMSTAMFFLATLAGRFARFLLLSLLVVKFGPEVVGIIMNSGKHHGMGILIGLCVLGIAWLIWHRVRRRKQSKSPASAG